jgi:hypothetical protein
MKAAQILNTLSTALLCALPTSIDAMRKVETRNLDVGEDEASRGLMHVVSHFLVVILVTMSIYCCR